jgi:hypothetical protein
MQKPIEPVEPGTTFSACVVCVCLAAYALILLVGAMR